jgi:hypothetical protein
MGFCALCLLIAGKTPFFKKSTFCKPLQITYVNNNFKWLIKIHPKTISPGTLMITIYHCGVGNGDWREEQ